MASGINSTFRQVGIATGIALLGTLFATKTHSVITSQLADISGAKGHTQQIATALQSGQVGQAIGQLPANVRGQVGLAAKTAFTQGLDQILLVAAIIALACGVISFLAIRQKDFVKHGEAAPAAAH